MAEEIRVTEVPAARNGPPPPGAEPSLGELVKQLAQDSAMLVRQEVALAKTEMSQKAAQVGKDVGFLAAGGALAYAGLLAILAGVIAVLGLVIPIWLAALLVGVLPVAVRGPSVGGSAATGSPLPAAASCEELLRNRAPRKPSATAPPRKMAGLLRAKPRAWSTISSTSVSRR